MKSTEQLKIPGYKICKLNCTECLADGSAIVVKYNIQHKLYDDFDTDVLAVEIQRSLGSIIILTTYLPPRRHNLPFIDIYRLLNNSIRNYIIADFNARYKHFVNSDNKIVGESLINLINQCKLIHLGLYFPLYLHTNSATTLDRIISNKNH